MYSRQSSIRGGSKQEGNRQTDKPELLDDQNNRPEKAYGAKAFDVYWQKNCVTLLGQSVNRRRPALLMRS